MAKESIIVNSEHEPQELPTLHWDQLRALMDYQEITFPQLAKIAHTPDSTLRKLFQGSTKDPCVSTLYPIIRALGASFDRFLGLAPNRDFTKEDSEHDPTTIDSIQRQMSELEENLANQEERLLFKRGRIHELEIEVEHLRTENAAHARSIKHLENMNAKREKELRRHRWIMCCLVLIAVAFAAAAIYLLWELLNPTRGKFKFY